MYSWKCKCTSNHLSCTCVECRIKKLAVQLLKLPLTASYVNVMLIEPFEIWAAQAVVIYFWMLSVDGSLNG